MAEHDDQDYDFGITIISPEGRIFQVEYARESVKRGATAVGVVYKDGVVLVAEKRVGSRLIEPDYSKKLYKINTNLAAASSGLVADSRVLIDLARSECQWNKVRYSEDLTTPELARSICETKQVYTQHGGVRPFGAALLIAGVDAGKPALYETDPSGAYRSLYAGGIGHGSSKVAAYLEDHWEPGLSKSDGILLALSALADQFEDELTIDNVEMGLIHGDGGYAEVEGKELKSQLQRLKA